MPDRSSPQPHWRTRLLPGSLLPKSRFAWWYFFLSLVTLVPGTLLLGWLEYHWMETNSPWLRASMLLYAPLFIAPALLTPLLATRRLYAQDYPVPNGLLRWRIGMAIAMTLLIQLSVFLFEALVPGARAASDLVSRSLGLGQGVWSDIVLILAVAVLAPLGEEWLFRGLFFRSLRDGLARWLPLPLTSGIGIVLSSALFAVVHIGEGQITQWPILFVVGILLALTYEWTGSLLIPMLVHALNNTWALLVSTTLPDVHFSSPWLLAFTACSPLILLALAIPLLRCLPQATTYPPTSKKTSPPPLPDTSSGPLY